MSVSISGTMSRETIAHRVRQLRQQLRQEDLEAYIIPSADEHLNEYLPENKKRREWISGFTGSAGDALIGLDHAFLFVDSRYYEQADLEVFPDVFQLSKLGLEGHPSLLETLKRYSRIGVDPFTLTVEQFLAYQSELSRLGAVLIPVPGNLIDRIRTDNPVEETLPQITSLASKITGASIAEKLTQVRADMADARAALLPITRLDQIAWLYNLRGQDIPYNPVFESYALVTPDEAYLFVDASKIRAEDAGFLEKTVQILPYEDYLPILKQYAAGNHETAPESQPKILLDKKQTTYGTLNALSAEMQSLLAPESPNQPFRNEGLSRAMSQRINRYISQHTVQAAHPVLTQKAIKNPVEIAGMQQANLLASKAKIRLLFWLDRQMENEAPESLSEFDIKTVMEQCYAEDPAFFGLSFNTIAAAGIHSSIVHYGTPSPEYQLQSNTFLLIDSGAQYLCEDWAGTTDDTRTVWIGDPPPAESLETQRYTQVLKAHIHCAAQRFPQGTPGSYLDAITRAGLWNAGLDFGHGTGHGVGAFLNVHEGPNGIHRLAAETFKPGMITSIEPGFYRSGWGGIRLENLYRVVDTDTKTAPDGKPLYAFEPLTYVPFDSRLIDIQALSSEEGAWLHAYHTAIVEKMRPLLKPQEMDWLKKYCQIV